MPGFSTFLSVSRFHIVAIAALGTFTFGWLFTGQHLWLLSAICALDWFIVNILNRVVDLSEDKANAITGVAFVDAHRKAIVWGGFLLLGVSLVAVQLMHPELLVPRLAYHTLGLAYNWPILPGKKRIKQLYFWKNTASAMGFVLTVFCYPLAVNGWQPNEALGISWATVWLTGAFFTLFELSYEVIYDLRDEHGDRAEGVQTYPVVHGTQGAMRIVDGLLLASALCLLVGYALEVVPWRIFCMIAAPLINFVAYRHFMKRGITSRDCIRLTWAGASLLVCYHLWIAAGLPGVGL